jgi:hypothetical protein
VTVGEDGGVAGEGGEVVEQAAEAADGLAVGVGLGAGFGGGGRRVVAGEGEAFLDELDPHAFVGEAAHDASQIVEVAGESVHRVDNDAVAVAYERQHLVEFRAEGVLAGGLVGEGPFDGDAVELAHGVLVDVADPDVADAHRPGSFHSGMSG